MWEVMSVFVSSILASTAETAGLRALVAVALAVIALVMIDRMKPATPKRPIPVPVERRATPLYTEPERHDRLRSAASLSAGAVVAGAVVACVLGFLLAITLEFVGGLLRS